jgi:hypothetical protein
MIATVMERICFTIPLQQIAATIAMIHMTKTLTMMVTMMIRNSKRQPVRAGANCFDL